MHGSHHVHCGRRGLFFILAPFGSVGSGFSPAGVRVICVCPGVIQTPMNDRLTVEEAEDLMASIPLDRFGTPEEVAEALVFLASDKASYITGAVLDVNGGI
ncbi:MAG: SDR family oxidoreductase [Clostridia bacterium]|nr:SDR family oxidoreductase [Clostridia bacterium]